MDDSRRLVATVADSDRGNHSFCAFINGNRDRYCSKVKVQYRSPHSLPVESCRDYLPSLLIAEVINLIMEFEERATTAIYIRVKRFAETYFLLCDEFETVESLKGRLLGVLSKIKFELPKQEEPLTTDDIRLCIKNRVSYSF